MEMFLLMIVIIMSAVAVTYAGEIYLYLCLLIGSLFKKKKKNAKK